MNLVFDAINLILEGLNHLSRNFQLLRPYFRVYLLHLIYSFGLMFFEFYRTDFSYWAAIEEAFLLKVQITFFKWIVQRIENLFDTFFPVILKKSDEFVVVVETIFDLMNDFFKLAKMFQKKIYSFLKTVDFGVFYIFDGVFEVWMLFGKLFF